MFKLFTGFVLGVAIAYAVQRANRELPEMGYLGWSGPHPSRDKQNH